jgi:hypothetical protein
MKLNDPKHSLGSSIYDLQKAAGFPVIPTAAMGRSGDDQRIGIE